MTRIRLLEGDITAIPADALVNPTDTTLSGRGQGIDAQVHRLAGSDLTRACAQIGTCQVGEAHLTPGYGLPVRYVVHVVGPEWRGGGQDEAQWLRQAYLAALAQAASMGCRVLTVPAVSTGAMGYPIERAAPVAIGAISECIATHPDWFDEIVLVMMSQEGMAAYAPFIGSHS
ncbi:RNase III inhibitor [bacterium]|nr:RNase III inhibitor [bacterium]